MATWTVKELINDKYKLLGVPHFQRGLVWSKEAVARLLESLFYDTPCGTLILWEAKEPEKEGIQLPGAEQLKYLIIDGQQRIRSIHDVLTGLQTESFDIIEDSESEVDSDDNGNHEQQKIWCINLTRVPELSSLLDDTLQGYPLFIKAKDPRTPGWKRFKYNLVPLQMMLRREIVKDISKLLKPAPHTDADQVLRKVNSIKLFKRAQQILSREFPIIIKEERDGKNGINELVQIYNRINSGGVRVESEERAFAALVSIRYDTNKWLQDLFHEFHPRKALFEPADKFLDRDDILQRTKEKNFGFKLFMRTFVQTCNFHFNQGLGSGSFSFDTLTRSAIQKKLRDPGNAENFTALFDGSKAVLKYVRDIVRDDLYCDSFQFLPETLSLMPVFQLLLKYPQLVDLEKYRPLLRLAILRLMLANLTQRAILNLVSKIRRTNTLEECANIIQKVTVPSLSKMLKNSNSLQDRYILLLYWLERKHGACDFSYKNLPSGIPEGLKKLTKDTKEVPVEIQFKPEKQHIIPYSILEHMYDISGRSRISKHPINNIGNITYISSYLNSFEGGLGAKPINWRLDDINNFRNHFLLGTTDNCSTSEVLRLYDEIINDSVDQDEKMKKYEEFYAHRIELIADGFSNWLEELKQSLPRFDREEPVASLFAPTNYDKLRELDYDNIIEDSIIKIMEYGVTVRKLKETPLALYISAKKSKKQSLAQLRLKKTSIILKFHRINSDLARAIINVIHREKYETKDLNRDGVKHPLPVRENGIKDTEKVLRVIIDYLKDSKTDYSEEAKRVKRIVVTTSTKWSKSNEIDFFTKIKTNLQKDEFKAMQRMYDFCRSYGLEINWGNGNTMGSLNAYFNNPSRVKIFSVDTNGKLYLSFRYLDGDSFMESFRDYFAREVTHKLGLKLPDDFKNHSVRFDHWVPKVEGFINILKDLRDKYSQRPK